MSDINQYARVLLLLTTETDLQLSSSYCRSDELVLELEQKFLSILSTAGADELFDCRFLGELLFTEMCNHGVIESLEDFHAGTYYNYKLQRYTPFRNKVLTQDDIFHRANAIGPRFFPDVFDSFESKKSPNFLPLNLNIQAPASDRIVTLQDNHRVDLENSTTELVNLFERENGLDGDPVDRDLIVGQLKAGRELIRAHTFRAYLLYNALISALGKLIEKYGTAAIGTAAKRLLELLIEHVFVK